MGQIRHATIGALSNCVRYISVLDRAVDRTKQRDESWSKFRSDPALAGLKHAVHLGQQARNLAESARLLVKQLKYRDIKYNQRFSPLRLYEDIRLSMEYETVRKTMKWNLSTNLDRKYEVMGDKMLMWMAMYNLMDNALKYAAQTSTISVSLTLIRDTWKFEIKNEGSYILPQERRLIFDLFFRGRQVDHLNPEDWNRDWIANYSNDLGSP